MNVERNKNWNFRLFGPLSFIKGVEGYTGFILVNTDYESLAYNLDLSKWNLFWFIQANYELPFDINFELSGNYGTGALEGQVDVDWLADLDFSFGKKFLEEKLKINLGFSSMLNRGFIGNIDYGTGTAAVESNGSRQSIQLRLVYSFGSKFGKKVPPIGKFPEKKKIESEMTISGSALWDLKKIIPVQSKLRKQDCWHFSSLPCHEYRTRIGYVRKS